MKYYPQNSHISVLDAVFTVEHNKIGTDLYSKPRDAHNYIIGNFWHQSSKKNHHLQFDLHNSKYWQQQLKLPKKKKRYNTFYT